MSNKRLIINNKLVCSYCNTAKEISNFYKRGDWYVGYCKKCCQEKRKVRGNQQKRHLCLCGCGSRCNNKYIRGHSNRSLEIRKQISMTMLEKYSSGWNKPLIRHTDYYVQDLRHRVRSLWEENICRIFKHLNFVYIYEPRRFKLSDGTSYLPDLYIPDLDIYVEIKGRWRNKAEDLTKANCFIKDKLGDMMIINQYLYKVLFDMFKDDLGLQYRRDRKAVEARPCMTEF